MKQLYFILLMVLILPSCYAQDAGLTMNGYVKDLFMLYNPGQTIPGTEQDLMTLNTVHNRLNMKWYISQQFTAVFEMRNRIISGSMIRNYPEYKQFIDKDYGYLNLSFVPVDNESWIVNSMIDRVYLDWTTGSWQFRLGRQRVNWGIGLVWNPNDLFNSFSYFDFDYEERPGTDGVMIKYYTGQTSSAEVVYNPGNHAGETALAGRYRFSKWNYDFQAIGGWAGPDWVIGGGWAGDIEGGGFRGELTHFFPREKDSGSEEATVLSVGGDYTFPNSLYAHAAFLYNSQGKSGNAGGTDILFNRNMSAKYLSYARYSLFAQISYPVTPLLNSDLSAIINPGDGSCYVGPAFTYSLQNNLELMLTCQLFSGKTGSEFGDIGQLYYARLKWSF